MKTAMTFLVNSFSLQMRILVGSNPTKKIMSCLWALSSDGRAPALQAGGRGFDSRRVHHPAWWNL